MATSADAIEQANDTTYGLGAAVFTQNIARAIRVSNAMEAGTVWVRCVFSLFFFPFWQGLTFFFLSLWNR